MNVIQKEKKGLIGISIFMIIVAVLLVTFGIILTINGVKSTSDTFGIVKLVFGILMIILSVPCGLFGIRFIFVGFAIKATEGSIKMGNIAKDGGTVNMKKCDKCGTEIKDGETVCSNCGKNFEN